MRESSESASQAQIETLDRRKHRSFAAPNQGREAQGWEDAALAQGRGHGDLRRVGGRSGQGKPSVQRGARAACVVRSDRQPVVHAHFDAAWETRGAARAAPSHAVHLLTPPLPVRSWCDAAP